MVKFNKQERQEQAESRILYEAILENNLGKLKLLISTVDDYSKKYYSALNEMSEMISPIEIAVLADKPDAVKYLYTVKVPGASLQNKMLQTVGKTNDSKQIISFIIDHESFKLKPSELTVIFSQANDLVQEKLIEKYGSQIFDFLGIDNTNLDSVVKFRSALLYEKWKEYTGDASLASYQNDIKILSSFREYKAGEGKILKKAIKKYAELVSNPKDATDFISILNIETDLLFCHGFSMDDPELKTALKNVYTQVFNDEREIKKFLQSYDENAVSISILDFILENKQTNLLEILAAVNTTKSLTLKKSINKPNMALYAFLIKANYVSQEKFTAEVASYLFNEDNNNRLTVEQKGFDPTLPSHLGNYPLQTLSLIVEDTGAHLNLETLYNAKTLFFQSKRPLEFKDIDKFVGWFSKPGDFEVIMTIKAESNVCRNSNKQCLEYESFTIDSFYDFVNECHMSNNLKAPADLEEVSLTLHEQKIEIQTTAGIVASVTIDSDASLVISGECAAI